MQGESSQFALAGTPVSTVRSAFHSGVDVFEGEHSPALAVEWRSVTVLEPVRSKKTEAESSSRHILDDVSGFAVPGELLVIMGPSDAGKTTLLNVLAGRVPTGTSARSSVTISGEQMSTTQAQRYTALVQSNDLFINTLTVREHLLFRAYFHRKNTRHSETECQHCVDQVIQQNGLSEVRNSAIGRLSASLKKRLAIASVLLGHASILLVDEPTLGLDNFTAASVVSQLQRVASRGKMTVIATISTPTSDVFARFGRILLLGAGGKVAFHGPASSATEYFAEHGHHCPPQFSSADFLVGLVSVTPSMPSLVWEDTDHEIAEATDDAARIESLAKVWETYRLSDAYKATLPPLHAAAIETGFESAKRLQASPSIAMGITSAAYSLMVLARRNIARLRNKTTLLMLTVLPMTVSVIIGLVYLQPDMDQLGVQSLSSIFFLFTAALVKINAAVQLMAMPSELAVVSREHRTGLYHVVAWYLAKNVTELPQQIVEPFFFLLPAYFMAGIGHGAELFFYIAAVLVLVTSAAVGYGYMVSCLARNTRVALPIGIGILVPMLILGGVLVNPKSIRDYLAWLEYTSPFKYGFEAQMNLFWERVDTISCYPAAKCTATTGLAVLVSRSLTERSPWTSGLLLVALNASFRLVGLLSLLTM